MFQFLLDLHREREKKKEESKIKERKIEKNNWLN